MKKVKGLFIVVGDTAPSEHSAVLLPGLQLSCSASCSSGAAAVEPRTLAAASSGVLKLLLRMPGLVVLLPQSPALPVAGAVHAAAAAAMQALAAARRLLSAVGSVRRSGRTPTSHAAVGCCWADTIT